MERPGEIVGKTALLRDVWQLRFTPETNSIAVHASRLRTKLALAGINAVVQTAPSGGYFLAPMPSAAMRRGHALDETARARDDRRIITRREQA